MDKQLEWITSILNRSGIKYWIDSGTLLGMIREKKLIDNDNDLDLSIWHTDVNRVLKLIAEIKREGYRVRILYYAGNIIKIKCIPNDKKTRIIDISVFRRSLKEFAWSPQAVDKVFDSLFFRIIRRVLMFFWLSAAKKVSVDKTPWVYIINIYTWWIPVNYFENIIFLEEYEIYVPKRYLDYLNFRYGDWQTPKPEWNFVTDDKGLKNVAPDLLL